MYWTESGGLTLAGQAVVASFLASLASGLGGLLMIALPRLSRRVYDTLLGFSAGVMLAAATLSLLWPALQTGGLGAVAAGLVAGGVAIVVLDRFVPHLEPHFAPYLSGGQPGFSFLLIAAMTLHNLPEGLSVGVAYGHGEGRFGLVVALAIAAQNIPEGLAVAAPLRAAGASRMRALLWATASGLVEPIGAAAGFHFVDSMRGLVPFGLALAAGAMVFVVSDQLIPESRSQAKDKASSLAVLGGFLLVSALIKILG